MNIGNEYDTIPELHNHHNFTMHYRITQPTKHLYHDQST